MAKMDDRVFSPPISFLSWGEARVYQKVFSQ